VTDEAMPDAASTCVACSGRWPDPADRIAELPSSVVYLHTDQFFPGWSVLVLRRHATELFELEPEQRARLMDEVSDVARALMLAFDARKVNYALLGNLLPHVHWHLVPRLADDPAPREPVFAVAHDPLPLRATERAERIARIRSRLGSMSADWR
jgi:diadenosine tetraphosphate (Ap4A) HIT family hydrolase